MRDETGFMDALYDSLENVREEGIAPTIENFIPLKVLHSSEDSFTYETEIAMRRFTKQMFSDLYYGTMQSCCGGSGVVRWNATDSAWKCTDCGSIKSNNANYYRENTPGIGVDLANSPYDTLFKCQCGSEKVHGNNTGHSSWCPKYKKV